MRAAGILFVLAAAFVPAWAAAGTGDNLPVGGTATPTPAPSGSPGTANPFGSASPTPTPGPIGNGYAILGYRGASAAGGVIPVATVSTAPPSPFPASNATGFYVDITGRLSESYAAVLRFHDYVIHGADQPVVNLSEGALLYMPRGGRLAIGIGYGSLQRSSSNTSANAVGAGAALLPDLRHPVSPFASLFYYPSARTLGSTAAITAASAGVIVRPANSGLLFQLGYAYLGYPNQNSSPTSLSGLQIGLGASF